MDQKDTVPVEFPRGDPAGRRVARQRAARLAEAGRLASVLVPLLGRAGFDAAGARELSKAIAAQEQTELLRADGHIEPRRRFKGGPLRRVSASDQHRLYIDESGKSLIHGSPYFSLGAVAMTAAEAERYRLRADSIKERFWGHTGFVFHEPEIRRRNGRFYFDGNTAVQEDFDRAIERLIADTAFVAFGVGIRKPKFVEFIRSGTDAYLSIDMYSVAIQMLLERYVDYRAMSSSVRTLSKVTFEAQGAVEDAQHQRDYADILLSGTQWIADSAFQQWLETGVEFTPKQGSDPMELADMLSRDIYEWIEGGCSAWPGRWRLFTQRIYCRGDRGRGKFGVKVFPDSDIRQQVEAHRATIEREE